MAAPAWITPAGLIGTLTERVTVTTPISIQASNAISLTIISGVLPSGVRLDVSGNIYGTPHSVGITTRTEFVVRASNADGVRDRTFYLDISGETPPLWITPPGFLKIGPNGQYYSIDGEFVDYQLSATYDVLPPGQKLRYYIPELQGQLPPGLILTEDGRITGQVKDNLTLDYKAKNTSGYDLESYDFYPYDHIFTSPTGSPRQVRFLAKTYQFKVVATDGVASSKQTFKITVENPESLRVDDTLINIDTSQYTADASYLLSPQWLTPANLGYIRANNECIIELSSYDFEAGLGPITYNYLASESWKPFIEYRIGTPILYNGKTYICTYNHTSTVHFNSEYWEVNNLPPHFKLDTVSGTLYASIPYQPAFSKTYTFTIFVNKTETKTMASTSSLRKFTVVIKGDVESSIEWISDTNLGTVIPGRQSELSVVAKHLGVDYTIQYKLVSGRLPAGLVLNFDGTISGSVNYGSQTNFYELLGDESHSPLIIDGGTTTFDRIYHFSIEAGDTYGQTSIIKDFTMLVKETDLTKYTSMYVQPLLSVDSRDNFKTFINNPYVFDSSLIYRIQDPAFGLQQKLQLVIEHGIQQADLGTYATAMLNYFYNKTYYFGDVQWSKALDSAGNYVYDVVYVNLIDPLQKNNIVGLNGSKTVGTATINPNSTLNMKNNLQSVTVQGSTIKTDEFLLPRFMRTIQPTTGNPLGYVLVAPLCYALPGKGDTIVKRIAAVGFDFRTIDFTVDRLVVKDNLANNGTKYLLFPRKDAFGNNIGGELGYLFGPDDIELFTEDGIPLEVQFI